MTPRLMLLDSASLYFRAYFGVPDRFTGRDGTPTNAVRGFLDAVTRLIDQHRPDELVACWDDDWRPQFRVDLVPSYKAHRVADTAGAGQDDEGEEVPDALEVQVPVIADLLAALGICRVGRPGFEADDVISQCARRHVGAVDIVTGDRDLFQLVDDEHGVRVLYTARGVRKLQVVDGQWLRDKYGVAPQHYVDFAVLRGDSSDGLPGVSGIGDKTAARLVDEMGGLRLILAAASDPASPLSPAMRAKLLEAADYLHRAEAVVRLDQGVPLPPGPCPLPQQPADPDALAALAEQYAIGGPVERLVAALEEHAPTGA